MYKYLLLITFLTLHHLISTPENQINDTPLDATVKKIFITPASIVPDAPQQVTMAEGNSKINDNEPCCGDAYYCKSCCEGEVSCNPDYRRTYYPSCNEFWCPSAKTLNKSDNDNFIGRCRPNYGCKLSTWNSFFCCVFLCPSKIFGETQHYNRRFFW